MNLHVLEKKRGAIKNGKNVQTPVMVNSTLKKPHLRQQWTKPPAPVSADGIKLSVKKPPRKKRDDRNHRIYVYQIPKTNFMYLGRNVLANKGRDKSHKDNIEKGQGFLFHLVAKSLGVDIHKLKPTILIPKVRGDKAASTMEKDIIKTGKYILNIVSNPLWQGVKWKDVAACFFGVKNTENVNTHITNVHPIPTFKK